MTATTGNITRILQLLEKGNARQRRDCAMLLKEEGLTKEDLVNKTPKVMNTPDLNLRAIIFGVN